MKRITRTVDTFHIYASIVSMENGKLKLGDLTRVSVTGRTVSEKNALKFIQKTYGKNNQYVISKIEKESTTYALPLDVFMKYAEPITAVEQTEPEE